MMPMKKALSDMKRAASARNETTRLSALATGLRLMTTPAPKISINEAKIQKRNEDIFQATDEHRSNTDVKLESEKSVIICVDLWLLFLIVPFQDNSMHHAADLQEFIFVMHHFFAGKSGNGIILPQINRLFRANFFAHAAKNAADHVDIELGRIFFDLGEPVVLGNFARNNFNRARRTNEFAKLTGNAANPAIRVADQCGCAAIMLRQIRIPFFLGILHRHFRPAENHVLEMFERDRESGRDCRQKHSLAPVQVRSW